MIKNKMSSNNVIGSLPKAMHTGEFEWLIKLSDEILEKDRYLDSPTFSFSHASWFARIYPKGYEDTEYISLYLWKKDTQSEINVQYSLEMLLNGMQFKKFEATSTFGKDRNWGWAKFLLRSVVVDQWSKKPEDCQLTIKIRMRDNVPPKEGSNPNVSPNSGPELAAIMKIGTPVVRGVDWAYNDHDGPRPSEGSVVRELYGGGFVCVQWDTGGRYRYRMGAEGKYDLKLAHPLPVQQPDSLPDSLDENGEDNATSKLNSVYKMCHDLKQLLLNEEGSDVTLQVQDQQFKAHRSILTSRSSVFAAMFRHDTKEKATGVVNIEDCEPSSFPVLLEFMYCCSTEKLSVENVFDLYTSADKYDMEDLKIECLKFIKKYLSVDTFCETVKLALQHPDSNLLDMVVEYFARNMKEIIVTVKWQAFLAENYIQCNEIFIKVSAHWQLKPLNT